ncbi:unnamed protein product [Knipowitschia caucasica]
MYSLFLSAAAPHVTQESQSGDWARAVHAGTQAMMRYGGAEPGDRTMLDALCPAADELMRLSTAPPGGHMEVLQAAAECASLGAASTADLEARAGRASYISSERVHEPDPGAVAVATVFRAVLQALQM